MQSWFSISSIYLHKYFHVTFLNLVTIWNISLNHIFTQSELEINWKNTCQKINITFNNFPLFFPGDSCKSSEAAHRGVLIKRCFENMQQSYRWTTSMPNCDFNKVSKQLYWNHTSTWVFFCKFVAYFQNTFS